jgi:hypothetical protein
VRPTRHFVGIGASKVAARLALGKQLEHLLGARHDDLAHVLHEETALLALVDGEVVRVVGEQIADLLRVFLFELSGCMQIQHLV